MKKEHVTLRKKDKAYLEKLVKQKDTPIKMYKRALALLELDRGRSYTEVSQSIGVVIQTTSRWAKKYRETGLEFLKDKARPGRPRVIDGLQRAKITALACSDPPEGYERWSLRMLADKAIELKLVETISYGEVRLVLKKTISNRI